MGRVTARVRRTRVDAGSPRRTDRPDRVVVEEPLEIRIGGVAVATTMRTPGDDTDLAIGHLLTEGLLHEADEVATITWCGDTGGDGLATYNVLDVSLAPDVALHAPPRTRTEPMTSACGVCGTASIEAIRTALRYSPRTDPIVLPGRFVAGLPDVLRTRQPVFDRTGGTHGAAVLDPDGEVLAAREDVGRHNAVDKVIGALARQRSLPLAGTVLVVSARASFEIVQKAAMAGIPVLAAVGAPTSLAVELSNEVGMTLAAFVRDGALSVYSRADRVTSPG
jgi:FdhD protein